MELLDTDVVIDVQRKHLPAIEWFETLTEAPAVPGLVVMELIQDAQNARQVRQVLKLIEPFVVLWPTETDCNRALANFVAYHRSQGLGLLDSLIASCAVGLSATLCTFNAKHYRMVPELVIKQPYVR